MPDEPAPGEDRIDRLERKLDELLAGGHAAAEQHEETRLGRPTEVQEMVRMELEKAEAEKAAAAKRDAARDAAEAEQRTLAQTVANLAKLTEQKPEQPQPRRQRVMWGKR